jgi:precorrin-8X/cobalt-precorrin-8 methylmutase
MVQFEIKHPAIKEPEQIEKLSLETIMNEANSYPVFKRYSEEEQKVIQRMIHSTTCFDTIINNIWFSEKAIERIKVLLKQEATIITDTNMIKTGISSIYTEKYNNHVICYVSESDVKQKATENKTTRTVIAVQKAIEENKNKPIILACGNAPTYIYAAIEKVLTGDFNLSKIALIALPVGFINVIESKEYAIEFLNKTDAEGITIKGRYGGSTLVVSGLHAIYKLL